MFLIRREQMEFFARRQRDGFVDRMTGYLRRAFPECFQAMTDDEVRAWAAAATAKAERWGVDTEPEAAQLLLLFLLLGVDADETTPWVREALSDRRLLARGKVRAIVALARERAVPGLESVVLDGVVEEA
jgi:hypothetical protein